MEKKDIIICRCEDVTLKQIHDLLNKGYTDIEELERLLRIGMGPCQGNNCMQLLHREVAKFTNKKLEEIKTAKIRPLTMGIPLEKIKESLDDES